MIFHKSKIAFFLIYIIIISSLYSCSKDDINRLKIQGFVNINLYIDQYPDLQIPGNALYINHDSSKKIGYKGNGIYVICIIPYEEYRCFDATCTNHTEESEHIIINNKGDIFATCPVCNAQFDMFFGYPIKKPAKIPLTKYRTTYSHALRKIRISNSY